jgi:hypothetical protein
MKQLTKHEIEKARMMKAARSAIRLKHSLNADEEIYRRLPELESKIADALLKGEPLRLTTEQILKDVEA